MFWRNVGLHQILVMFRAVLRKALFLETVYIIAGIIHGWRTRKSMHSQSFAVRESKCDFDCSNTMLLTIVFQVCLSGIDPPCPIVTRGRVVSYVGKRRYNADLRCKTTPEVRNFIKVIEILKCFLTRIGASCAHIINSSTHTCVWFLA